MCIYLFLQRCGRNDICWFREITKITINFVIYFISRCIIEMSTVPKVPNISIMFNINDLL